MDLSYTSPIKFDFVPIPGTTINFIFKLKSSKSIVKINIDTNIYYKDPFITGRIFLTNSGMQSVYTSSQDQTISLKFNIPEFKNRTQSYINISIDNTNFKEKVIIEDLILETDINSMKYATPSVTIAVPNIQPKIGTQPLQNINRDIKEWHDKVILVSTWDIKCGIAQYTKDLLDCLTKIYPEKFSVRNIESANNIGARLIHLQHEFGILPKPPIIGGKVIITWHSVTRNISDIMRLFESNMDVVAHIVACDGAREYINTTKDVFVVKLGSKIINPIRKDDARKFLNISTNKNIGFVFGFQSPNKNYSRLINAAKNTNILLIISGSIHFGGFEYGISNSDNVIFLGKHLTEDEIDLYASASDLLLFDYNPQDHYSSSSALHRTIGTGRPVICSNTKHFNDIDNIPKFDTQIDLEKCILYALDNQETLGKRSLQYAEETSIELMTKKHIEIYERYIDL